MGPGETAKQVEKQRQTKKSIQRGQTIVQAAHYDRMALSECFQSPGSIWLSGLAPQFNQLFLVS